MLLKLPQQLEMIYFLSTIQYEMDAKYQEKSMLTDNSQENKFLGWAELYADRNSTVKAA